MEYELFEGRRRRRGEGVEGGTEGCVGLAGEHQRLGEPGSGRGLRAVVGASRGAPGAPGGHRSAQDTQRLSDQMATCLWPEKRCNSSVSEVRCGRFGVDGGAIASVG